MRVLGLTGGIATGKSTAVECFKKLDPTVSVFCADASVARIYTDPAVLTELESIVGDSAVIKDGALNREWLRKRLFSNSGLKQEIQDLIHPLVRKDCLECLEESRRSVSTSSFIADVPLLFEGGFDFGQDANLVVAVSRETQVQRLIMRNGFDDATVQAILAAQLPISQKEKCADVVLWNEGPIGVLETQIQRFIENKYQ
ncbi:dephospho-CoA kinase [Rubritalea spongiae]|uniref:Dephospho-CoA kinase n=1 Tax=Rubritalea spongiae TaxID=430797 RepID=A0ABW5E2K9_9BACT